MVYSSAEVFKFFSFSISYSLYIFCYSTKESMWDKDTMMLTIPITDKTEGLKEEILG